MAIKSSWFRIVKSTIFCLLWIWWLFYWLYCHATYWEMEEKDSFLWSLQICALIYRSLPYPFSNVKSSVLLKLFLCSSILQNLFDFLTSLFSLIYPFEADREEILNYSQRKFMTYLYDSPFFFFMYFFAFCFLGWLRSMLPENHP